ncbi:CDP-alcohol phosphatidyltransferase family protein [Geodermatophilus sp. SYSU D00703]
MTATVERPAAPAGESLRATVARLSAAQKGAAGAPAYSRFVNRRLGRLFAAVAFHAGLTPNAVTGISAAFTATGIALLVLVPPSWLAGTAVTACLLIGYALDSADGQLARLRGGGSPAGEWLDHMVDAVKLLSLHLAVLVGLFRFEAVETSALLLVPIGYCIADGALFFAMMLNEALRAQHGVATRAQPSGPAPGLRRSLVNLPTDYGVLCLSFLLLGAPTVFLAGYGVLLLATAAHLGLGSVTWYREMGRLPR